MRTVFIITLAMLFYLIDSCSIKRVNESPIDSNYKEVYIISYGDDRFDHCDDLIDIKYGITSTGDTIELETIQRKCTEWQKRNYDVNDSRAYPKHPEQ